MEAQTNTALDFDGVDDFVEVGQSFDFDAPFTFEAWIYARSGDGGGRFVSNRGAGGWEMDVQGDPGSESIRWTFNAGVVVGVPFSPYMNTWTHVAGTWGGSTAGDARVYINGVEAGTGNFFGSITPSGTNLIFGRSTLGFGRFNGRLDEVRIFDAELDGPTIMAWMNSHVTAAHPNFANLVGDWRMDEGSGQTAASEVGSPGADGRLGAGTGADSFDPMWVASDVVPSEEVSVGAVKSRYLED